MDNQALTSQLRNNLATTKEQLNQTKSALDELSETRRHETEFSQHELQTYRKRLNELQLIVGKYESTADELRFENN